MKRDESFYLHHIIDAIAKVDEYLKGLDEIAFSQKTLVQDGVIRQIEIIGEATKRLSFDFRRRYQDIPWEDITGMRDKLIHDYFGVDIETVWLTAVDDLPTLKLEIEKILAAMLPE
jgi:uncharacterized protein with HEPN domain